MYNPHFIALFVVLCVAGSAYYEGAATVIPLLLVVVGIAWSLFTIKSDFPSCTKVTDTSHPAKFNRLFWICLIVVGEILLAFQSLLAAVVMICVIALIRCCVVPALICRQLIYSDYHEHLDMLASAETGDEDGYFRRVRDRNYYAMPQYGHSGSSAVGSLYMALCDPSWLGWCLREQAFWHNRNDDLSLDALAERFQNERHYDIAERMLKRALKVAEKGDPYHVRQIFSALVQGYSDQDDFVQAEKLLHSYPPAAFGIVPDNLAAASKFLELANLYYKQDKNEDAERFLLQSSQYFDEHIQSNQDVGKHHFNLSGFQSRLLSLFGDVYQNLHRYAEAESMVLKALAITRPVANDETNTDRGFHLQKSVHYLNKLGKLLQQQARYDEAELIFIEAINIVEPGAPHVVLHVTTSVTNLAKLYAEKGDCVALESQLQRMLKYSTVSLRERDLDLLIYMMGRLNNLAHFYCEHDKITEAHKLFQQSLVIAEQIVGVEHPLVAVCLTDLAEVDEQCGAVAEAKALRERAHTIVQRSVRISEKAFGREHSYVRKLRQGVIDPGTLHDSSHRISCRHSQVNTTPKIEMCENSDDSSSE